MAKRKQEHKEKVVFGRIVADPDVNGGRAMILHTDIEVRTVLRLHNRGLSHPQIRSRLPKLTNTDIDACLAWKARFMPVSLTRQFNHAANVNFFMLDENISYLLLHDTVRLFGKSSHVYADGLGGKPDEKIWTHLIANGYKAILTGDQDFVTIARKHRQVLLDQYGSIENCPFHVPVTIYVGKKHDPKDVLHLIEKYKDNIKAFAEKNDAAYAQLMPHEFAKMYLDCDNRPGRNPEQGYRPKKHKPKNNSQGPNP